MAPRGFTSRLLPKIGFRLNHLAAILSANSDARCETAGGISLYEMDSTAPEAAASRTKRSPGHISLIPFGSTLISVKDFPSI
jgi:hypothetical protein